MITLHEFLVGFGVSALETGAVCAALWLGVSLLSYADKNRRQP